LVIKSIPIKGFWNCSLLLVNLIEKVVPFDELPLIRKGLAVQSEVSIFKIEGLRLVHYVKQNRQVNPHVHFLHQIYLDLGLGLHCLAIQLAIELKGRLSRDLALRPH
jgi:hypothetical protein